MPMYICSCMLGENIRTDLCRIQQLVEIQEVGQIMRFRGRAGGGGVGVGGGGRVDALLRTWRSRLEGMT